MIGAADVMRAVVVSLSSWLAGFLIAIFWGLWRLYNMKDKIQLSPPRYPFWLVTLWISSYVLMLAGVISVRWDNLGKEFTIHTIMALVALNVNLIAAYFTWRIGINGNRKDK